MTKDEKRQNQDQEQEQYDQEIAPDVTYDDIDRQFYIEGGGDA